MKYNNVFTRRVSCYLVERNSVSRRKKVEEKRDEKIIDRV
jgi:hypothetical protein